jgi:hypothetical protein
LNATDRRRWQELHDDRLIVDRGARWLRDQAWQESYAGLHNKDRAFMLATLLESLSLQLDAVPDGLRREAVRTAEWLIGGSTNVRF